VFLGTVNHLENVNVSRSRHAQISFLNCSTDVDISRTRDICFKLANITTSNAEISRTTDSELGVALNRRDSNPTAARDFGVNLLYFANVYITSTTNV